MTFQIALWMPAAHPQIRGDEPRRGLCGQGGVYAPVNRERCQFHRSAASLLAHGAPRQPQRNPDEDEATDRHPIVVVHHMQKQVRRRWGKQRIMGAWDSA